MDASLAVMAGGAGPAGDESTPVEVTLRIVNDGSIKPGDLVPPSEDMEDIKQGATYVTAYYKPVAVPKGTRAVRLEIGLSFFTGSKTDDKLFRCGLEYSFDGGKTYPQATWTITGDGEIPKGFPKISYRTDFWTDELDAFDVVVRPFIGAKMPCDIGVKVRFA